MKLTPVSPVPLDELIALYRAATPLKPRLFAAAVLQYARSETIGWRGDGELVAAVILYPMPNSTPGEECREAAFVCRPSFAAGLVPFVRFAQFTLRRFANDGPVRIRAHVARGHRPGQRIAALCGLTLVGVEAGFETWEFAHGQHH